MPDQSDAQVQAVPQKATADSVFYELTRSICPVCTTVINAQIHLRDCKVFMRKRCRAHGWFEGAIFRPRSVSHSAAARTGGSSR